MTNQQHPITPPQELVQQWLNEYAERGRAAEHLATQAARWGADQELEACCGWIESNLELGVNIIPEARAKFRYQASDQLRSARRPKPSNLKQQALDALDSFEGFTGSLEEVDIIRRALESLPNPQD